jgi:hypothetical protein
MNMDTYDTADKDEKFVEEWIAEHNGRMILGLAPDDLIHVRSRDAAGLIYYPGDGTYREFVDSGWYDGDDLSPVARAVFVARLRALADQIETTREAS